MIPASLSSASRILARWLGSREFSTRAGAKPLPRVADGAKPSFEKLVESVTRDVRPRAILDEWLSRGMVTIDAEDRVHLQESALVPPAGEEQQLYYFGRNLHDHIAAAVTNISDPQPRFLERAVHYDRLSKASAERLEALSRDIATEALQRANRDALQMSDEDAGGGWRWNFGIYIYAEEDPAVSKPKKAGRNG